MRLASVVIVGAGPAGLMAAEVLSREGVLVNVYDAMPSAGRKFLQAGRGGLNITHINDFFVFMLAYAEQQSWLSPMIAAFDNQAIQLWMKDLGVASFVGSSGRVFPDDKKAAPLLRAWLHRLRKQGVVFHMKHRFVGWHETEVQFETPIEKISVAADAVVLALGGASWPALGSDGRWVELLSQQSITVSPLKPAKCSFVV
nr:TIGR03862 family flavoprotein [Pseudomonadota bacterium]